MKFTYPTPQPILSYTGKEIAFEGTREYGWFIFFKEAGAAAPYASMAGTSGSEANAAKAKDGHLARLHAGGATIIDHGVVKGVQK